MTAKAKVLIVDDEPDLAQLLQVVLSQGGYETVVTTDPTEAAALARRESPDLVMCDIAMPGKDGYSVLEDLQQDPQTAACPVVFLTARQQFSERVKAFRFGVVGYFTKPFVADGLLRSVDKLVSERLGRSGVVREDGAAAADTLLEEARRDARSGILTVRDPAGASTLVIRQGQVVEQSAPLVQGPSTTAEFRELDPSREQIVSPGAGHTEGAQAATASGGGAPEWLRHALVVDDDEQFRGWLAELLRRDGFTVCEASDGEEGVSVALQLRPFIIISDFRMPRVDGFELCRRVRSHSLIRHTPLLFLSGWDDYRDRYRGLAAGGDEYLPKHTPVRELLMRVHLLLGRYVELGAPRRGEPTSGIRGRLELIGAPGLLQLCHSGRLSGRLTVRAEAAESVVWFGAGQIVGAEHGASRGADAVYDLLAWTLGDFEFTPEDPGRRRPLQESFEQLLLEGCRRLDERNARPDR